MDRRHFINHMGILGMGAVLSSCNCPDHGKTRPNVLFIAIDDLRTNIGCYGDPLAVTPHIDQLALEGTQFNHAYCQQAVCNPSRASLMTGRRPDTIHVWDLQTHFRDFIPDLVTLPQYFKNHGYHTQCIGKIYHDPQEAQDKVSWSVPEQLNVTTYEMKYATEKNLKGGIKPPTSIWRHGPAVECSDLPDSDYIDGKVADQGIQALETLKDRPFFLALGFRRPHLPFTCPRKYWDLYDRQDLAFPINPKAPQNVPSLAMHNWAELRNYLDIPDKGSLSPEKIAELRHGYYACTSFVDAQIGKVIKKLGKSGLRQNTVIILWSDHGYHLGEQNLWCKLTNFEWDTHVPLILSTPTQKSRGVQTNALVEFIDIYPTLAELCDLPISADLEGKSMVPLLNRPHQTWKKAAISQFPKPWGYSWKPGVMGYSLRTKRFRYNEWIEWKTKQVVSKELYDHQVDAHETINMVAKDEYQKYLQDLSQTLHEKINMN